MFLDENHNVKIGDFGLSRLMGDESIFATTHVGTPYYMSPEQINYQKYDEKSDIWSFGCVLYEVACMSAPFKATTQVDLSKQIKSGSIPPFPK